MIKNIIFDMGGVILNLNYQLTIDAFKKLGASQIDSVYAGAKAAKFFNDFEMGFTSESEFRNELKLHLDLVASDAELDAAWNAMLLDLPQERLDYLRSLHDRYRVFLFSNTNTIHLDAIKKICDQGQGFEFFKGCFEKDYYSFEIGARKPDVGAFLRVLRDRNLDPGETIFIDDNYQNVEGARMAGMHAIHLTHGMSLNEVEVMAKQINEQEVQQERQSKTVSI